MMLLLQLWPWPCAGIVLAIVIVTIIGAVTESKRPKNEK